MVGEEGCLSIPGYVGNVKRAEIVTVRALNRKGKEVKIKATHNLARVLQHEIDHLDGILYTDLIEKPDDLFLLSKRGSEYLSLERQAKRFRQRIDERAENHRPLVMSLGLAI